MTDYHKQSQGYGQNFSSKALKSYKRTQTALETWLGFRDEGAQLVVWGYGALSPEGANGLRRSRYTKAGIAGWCPLVTPSTLIGAPAPHPIPSRPVGAPLVVAEGRLGVPAARSRFRKARLGLAATAILASQGSDLRPTTAIGTDVGFGPSAASLLSGGVVLSRRCAVIISTRELRALLSFTRNGTNHNFVGIWFGGAYPRAAALRAVVAGGVVCLRSVNVSTFLILRCALQRHRA